MDKIFTWFIGGFCSLFSWIIRGFSSFFSWSIRCIYGFIPWCKRWYIYNKQKIPMIFTLIGAFFFTAFLDFDMQSGGFKLESHIAAIRKFTNSTYSNLSAFYLFAIYLVAIVQIFNSSSFSKKRSPISSILLTLLTILQVVLVGLYTSVFFLQQAKRTDYIIDSTAFFSFSVFIIGAFFFIVGTVFAWFYVDWKYVKEIE